MKLDGSVSGRALLFTVAGTLLVLAGLALLAVTIRGELKYRTIAQEHGGPVLDLGRNAHPAAGQLGYMARVVGTPHVLESPRDPDFNLQAVTPALSRHVEMFQWRAINFGDGVTYELDWVEQSPTNPAAKLTGRHANPPFPIKSMTFDAGRVQVDGFRLSEPLLRALPGSSPVEPDLKALPPNLAASFSRYQNYLVTSARPAVPELGDLRISWTKVPAQEMTFFARIDGDQLMPAPGARDGRGYDVDVGRVSLLDMFPDLPVPPASMVVNRVASVLLAALGIALLDWSCRRRRDVLLALGLAALLVGAVACMFWVSTDLASTTDWLVLALVGLGVTLWRLRLHKQRRLGGRS